MAETATRRRNGTAPEHGAATKPKSARGGTSGPAQKPKAATGATTKRKTKPASSGSGSKGTGSKGPAGKSKGTGSTAAGSKSPQSKGSATKGPIKRTARKAKDVVEKATPSTSAAKHPVRKLALAGAKKLAKSALSGMLEAGAGVIRSAADRAAATGHEAVEKTAHKRLPIQRSVDIAVPLRVVWEEWSALESIPEGVHTVTEIERDGAELFGRTSGPRTTAWEAEILDERPEQSFAWQSHEGSDCAGLITFHELSRRLTRVELNLDVVPTGPLESAQLALKLADRRAETELRRLKARLELINPDLYEDDGDGDAESHEPESHEPDETDEPDEPDEEADQDAAA